MKKQPVLLILLILSCSQVVAEEFAVDEAPPELSQFLSNYCVSCHGAAEPEADLRLDDFGASEWAETAALKKLRDVLVEAEMPPEEAKQHPGDTESARVRQLIKARMLDLGREQVAGVYKRLNRREYQNTINDIFGTSFDVAKRLPPDNLAEGFSNTGEHIYLSPLSMKQYAEVAFDIAEEVIPSRKPTVVTTRYVANVKNFNKRWDVKQKEDGLVLGEPVHGLMYLKKSLQLSAGIYDINVRATHYANRGRHGNELEETEPTSNDERKRLVIYEDQDIFSHRKNFVLIKTNQPRKIFLKPGNRLAISKNVVADTEQLERPEATRERHTTVINSIELTGPYNVVWPTKRMRSLFSHFDDEGYLNNFDSAISILARKLFRRVLRPAELQVYRDLAQQKISEGRNGNQAMQLVLKAMLCSPHFLYKHEGAGGELDDYSIASRLSYFLWSSCPDNELMELAVGGKLKDPVIRKQQFHRMLQDRKSERFADTFVAEWLELKKIRDVEPHVAFYREQDFLRVKDHLHREPIEFFKVVLNENLSALNFIDSDFVVINDLLNSLYHIGGAFPPDHGFAKVMLNKTGLRPDPRHVRRGGLIPQAGILLMTSDGTVTSPIYRGVWVQKTLLGQDFVPPNNVSTLPADVRGATSVKELVKQHREDSSCARCHNKIDPTGIALENYDVIGRWRDRYSKPVLVKEEGKAEYFKVEQTIDVSVDAELADGRQINGIDGLRKALLADNKKFTGALVKKLFVYCMGRNAVIQDEESIEQIRQASAKTDYRLKDMIEALVTSEAFRLR